ncbi:MAG: hypothetical protein L3J52_04540, partial [Proteobacteria bacterium]|nr:hypothetical protein [Pseudomonadota bacterium]
MLNNWAKSFFLTTFFLISALQIWLAWHSQLFGDEAFYWLEGQFPAWSYAELPGWTAWLAAFSETALPHHYFFLRLPHLLAALSIPFLGMAISKGLH